MPHDFNEAIIRKGGPQSSWCGGKVVDYIRENGVEVEFCFTDGTSARFEWVDDNGAPIKGKIQIKSLGIHIRATSARLGNRVRSVR